MRQFLKKHVLRQQTSRPMIIVVDTTKAGSASNTFVLPITKSTTETVKIKWGDGTSSSAVNGNNTHVYENSGIYNVTIDSQIFSGIKFNGVGDCLKVIEVVDFGTVINESLAGNFQGCLNLTKTSSKPIIHSSTTARYLFRLTGITTAPNLNTSNITDMTQMFFQSALTTVPTYDLSSVTTAVSMFFGVTLTTQSYSDFLINLATLPLQSGVSFHGGNSKYNPAAAIARAYLVSNFGWTITDGGAA